jgi:hypothetical protein
MCIVGRGKNGVVWVVEGLDEVLYQDLLQGRFMPLASFAKTSKNKPLARRRRLCLRAVRYSGRRAAAGVIICINCDWQQVSNTIPVFIIFHKALGKLDNNDLVEPEEIDFIKDKRIGI